MDGEFLVGGILLIGFIQSFLLICISMYRITVTYKLTCSRFEIHKIKPNMSTVKYILRNVPNVSADTNEVTEKLLFFKSYSAER